MATSVKTDPSGFVRIGDNIWVVEAEKQQKGDDTSQPTLILIFGWMDAKPAHIAKFSAGYRKLFPTANQLVVASTSWACFLRSASAAMHAMQPALDYFISQGVLGDNLRPHRILTHTMSNGGCMRLIHLAELIATMPPPRQERPPFKSAMVVDSAPGGDDPKHALIAFEAMIPSPLVRYPILAAFFCVHTLACLLGRADWRPFEPIRRAILNPNWLPWIVPPTKTSTTPSTPWLFVYTRADNTVPFEDTHKLTEVAEGRGMDIRREIYEDAPHVGNMRADPQRYWSAVEKVWSDALKLD